MDDLQARLEAQIWGCRWFVEALLAVRDSGLPDAWVGAGVIRDLVWDGLHDGFDPARVKDLDVAFFDATDLRPQRDRAAERALREGLFEVPWEATNQAAVHLWYPGWFGGPYPPVSCTEEAVGRWPETATSVAVQLTAGDELRICAPLGLADLLDGVWRRNPRQVSLDESRRRLHRHRVADRWPRVRIIAP
jgi:uncharacterized protein